MMTAKGFIKSLGIVLVLNIIVKTFWIFWVDASVQQHVGNNDYGMYYATLNLVLLCNIVLDFGITNAYIAEGNSMMTNRSKAIKLKLIFGVLYLLVVALVAAIVGIPSVWLCIPLALLQIANNFLTFHKYILQSEGKNKIDQVSSVLDRIIAGIVIMCAIFSPQYFFKFNTTAYAWTQAIAVGITIAYIRFFYIVDLPKAMLSKTDLMQMLRKAAPFTIIIILMAIVQRADVFFIKQLHHDAYNEIARYTYGYRILDALNNFGYTIATYLFLFYCTPTLHKSEIVKTTKIASTSLFALCAILLITIFFWGEQIAMRLYKTWNNEIQRMMLCNIIAFAGTALVHVYSTLLTARKAFKSLLLLIGFCVLFLSVLHLLYTAQFGALAATYITASTQLLFGIGCLIACKVKKLI